MTYKYSKRSLERLETCHPLLIQLMQRALLESPHDITILEGYRSKQKQDEYLRKGTSKVPWPHSKHNRRPSKAVDVAPWPIDWKDISRFEDIAKTIEKCWQDMCDEGLCDGWDLFHGAEWTRLVDWPHWELRRKE